MRRRSLLLSASAILMGALTGCSTPQRTPSSDAGIKTVAIVTVLQDDVPLRRIGMTIFNNEYTTLPMQGELNPFVLQVATDLLKKKRPDWQIKPAGVDPAPLSAHIRKVWNSWGSKDEPLADRWPAVAQAAEVDALLVIEEVLHEQGSGVSVDIRALPGLEPRLSVGVALGVRLVDRRGEVLAKRGTSNPLPIAAKDLAISDRVASALQPETAAALRRHVKAQVQSSLTEGLERLGY